MSLVVATILIALQGTAPPQAVTHFLGRWVATGDRARGQAAIWPSFTVEQKGTQVLVLLEGMKNTLDAEVYTDPVTNAATVLIIRRAIAPGRSQTILVRTLGPEEVRCELFAENDNRVAGRDVRRQHFVETFKLAPPPRR